MPGVELLSHRMYVLNILAHFVRLPYRKVGPSIFESQLCKPRNTWCCQSLNVCQSEKWRQLKKSVPSSGPLFGSCTHVPVPKVTQTWPCFYIFCLILHPTLLGCLWPGLTLLDWKVSLFLFFKFSFLITFNISNGVFSIITLPCNFWKMTLCLTHFPFVLSCLQVLRTV